MPQMERKSAMNKKSVEIKLKVIVSLLLTLCTYMYFHINSCGVLPLLYTASDVRNMTSHDAWIPSSRPHISMIIPLNSMIMCLAREYNVETIWLMNLIFWLTSIQYKMVTERMFFSIWNHQWMLLQISTDIYILKTATTDKWYICVTWIIKSDIDFFWFVNRAPNIFFKIITARTFKCLNLNYDELNFCRFLNRFKYQQYRYLEWNWTENDGLFWRFFQR